MRSGFVRCAVGGLLLALGLLLACGGGQEPPEIDRDDRPARDDRAVARDTGGGLFGNVGAGAAAPLAQRRGITLLAPEDTSPETDRAALEALYHATDGDGWDSSDNWLTDEPLGEWAGVETNESGRVVELNFYDNRLSGEMPPELGNLPNLILLNLNGNQLNGEIPPELGNLSNLFDLNLGSNRLSGDIPPELGNLTNLSAIYLSGNQLSGCVPSNLESQVGDANDFFNISFC